MLVVISDIHLSDETVGVLISDKTFSLFASRLRELAFQASWRTDGRYEPVNEINILLLGDILDPLQSTRWLEKDPGQEGYIRPWHDPLSETFTQKVHEITRAIIARNQAAIKVMKRISTGDGIGLPPANKHNKPDEYTLERIIPSVRIYYMVGNHDWFYHLPGAGYDAIRAEIIQAMGLSNHPGPFPHDLEQAEDELQKLLARYRVVARHGDHHDPFSYNQNTGRNNATLSDIYCSEVIYRFPFEVARQLGNNLPKKLVTGIQRLPNVRPLLATPLWLLDQVRRHGDDEKQANQIKAIWDDVISDFLSLNVLHSDQFASPRQRNTLKFIFGLSQKTSIQTIAGMSRLLRTHLKEEHISISRFAHQEKAIREGKADFVVYGHTHSQEITPIGKRTQNLKDPSPLYINTGTWATFIDYSQKLGLDDKTRPVHMLTCTAFYQDDERQGKKYENWWANFS